MRKKVNRYNITMTICIVLFLILTALVVIKDSLIIDRVGYSFISSFISDVRTPVVKFITNLGSSKVVIPVFVIIMILFIAFKKVEDGVFLGGCVFTDVVLNYIIKHIIRRARPIGLRLVKQGGYSFPSGHTMVSVAFYGFLIYLIYKRVKNKYLKITLITLLSILIFMIGCSRIYLGVHYTSDVLAGFSLSIAYLIIYISIVNKIKSRR